MFLNNSVFNYNLSIIRLNGVLLSFNNIKFVCDYGTVVDEETDVYWTISGEFSVIDVKEGQIIKGKINQ
jgi:hypothetical protein